MTTLNREEIICDYKEIITTNTKKAVLVDNEDYPLLSRYMWHENKAGYAVTGCGVRHFSMHRMILNPPPRFVIDHINHRTLDNRKSNLRICTLSQNQMNRFSNIGKSKYKGVTWKNGVKKWVAYIRVGDKQKTLGYFVNEEDAAKAYDEAAEKYFGEFALTNELTRKLLAEEATDEFFKATTC